MKVTPGTVLTVGGGVSLTLRNITFEGAANNTTPLLKVGTGGKLILEDGVRLINNITTADAGGVWVNGGALILNSGVEITGMAARQAGGVLVSALGNFIMNGGTIGGEDHGNTAAEENGGGGVLVASGSFEMNGGTIEHNSALEKFSGGGVCVLQTGTFNLNLGAIKYNTAEAADSGGGVCIISDDNNYEMNFVMNGAKARIEYNTAAEVRSGGGLYGRGFQINRGTIAHNTAEAEYSGGGVFATRGQLSGGTIAYNEAKAKHSGGGVYANGQPFGVRSGEITHNIARETDSGGGVYAAGSLSLTGGALMYNTACKTYSGGGVYVADGGSIFNDPGIQMMGLRNNTAYGGDSGGGLYVADGGRSSFQNAEIQGNTTPDIMQSKNYNCGVYVKSTLKGAFGIYLGTKVGSDNIVFLSNGATIWLWHPSAPGGIIAIIKHENLLPGTLLFRAERAEDLVYCTMYFDYGGPGYITTTGADWEWYGTYTE
jgi:hypothetical protein